MMDEERDSFIASNILRGKLTLIGGSVPGGLFLGPLYFYITAIFLYLSRFNPTGLAIIASTIGVITVIFLYKTALMVTSSKLIAFISGLFYASSYLIIIYNRTYWPLTFAPLVSILTINFLYQIIAAKKNGYIIPLGFVQLVGLQSDPSNFSSFLVVIFCFTFFGLIKKYRKQSLIVIFVLIIAHLPLLMFDLRHDFYISKNIYKFFSMKGQGKKQKITLAARLANSTESVNLFVNAFSRVIYVNHDYDVMKQITPRENLIDKRNKNIPIAVKFISVTAIIMYVFNTIRSKRLGDVLFLTQMVFIIFGIMIYSFFFPGYIHEWFLNVFWPGFCFIFAGFISYLFRYNNRLTKTVIITSVFIIAFLNLRNLITSDNSFGYAYKMQVINYMRQQLRGAPFALDGTVTYSGFEYLLQRNNLTPVKSLMDYEYNGWLYQKTDNPYPDKLVVFLSSIEDEKPLLMPQYKKYTIKEQIFGGYRVLIVDNATHWR
jgi:hypothetical protein